ncbi:MAG TPA: hypothetical protein VHR88_03310 [Solirubrobacteraceae bacterium]|nr:hypothetical protein [Solirubrobacteraceae bacterium]
MRKLFRTAGLGPWILASAVVLALGGSGVALAAGAISGTTARFTADNPRYVELARNTRTGDGGSSADVCNSSATAEPCLNMVNKGAGFAAAFRTRGLQGFRLQTSGTGQATPFVLDANATGKVQFLNADTVDGLDSTQLQAQFASVNADGSLANARGATASTRVGDGTYDVTFGSDVSKCAVTATEQTISDAGAVGVQGQSPTVIRVATRKGGGADGTGPSDRANRPFDLVVNC